MKFNLSRSSQAPPTPAPEVEEITSKLERLELFDEVDYVLKDITSKLEKLELADETDCILKMITLELEHLYLTDEMDW